MFQIKWCEDVRKIKWCVTSKQSPTESVDYSVDCTWNGTDFGDALTFPPKAQKSPLTHSHFFVAHYINTYFPIFLFLFLSFSSKNFLFLSFTALNSPTRLLFSSHSLIYLYLELGSVWYGGFGGEGRGRKIFVRWIFKYWRSGVEIF